MDDTARIAKLPRWAQDRIRDLERELGEAIKRIEADNGSAGTDTIAEPHHDYPFYLPDGARVRFQLGGGYEQYIDCHITERRRGQRCLEIHSGDMLVLHPMSGNLANATVER